MLGTVVLNNFLNKISITYILKHNVSIKWRESLPYLVKAQKKIFYRVQIIFHTSRLGMSF